MKYNELNFIRKLLGLLYGILLLFYPNEKIRKSSFIIIFLGIFMRFWAAGTIRKNKSLSVKGPYSICRNPLYLGSFLVGAGLSIALLPLFLVILFPILFLSVYIPKMYQEEDDLKEIFGNDFKKYQRNIELFVPSYKNFEKTEFSFRQAIKNKEYNTILGVLAVFILIKIKKSIKNLYFS